MQPMVMSKTYIYWPKSNDTHSLWSQHFFFNEQGERERYSNHLKNEELKASQDIQGIY